MRNFVDKLHSGLHLVKCLASTQGPSVRVNAVLPGLLKTEWVSTLSEFALYKLADYVSGRTTGPCPHRESDDEVIPKKRGVSWFSSAYVE